MYPNCGYTLLRPIQLLPLLSFTPLLPIPRFSTAFNIYPYILYLSRCYVYNITAALSFSFPSLLSPCSIN
jgi:hypothetical protein